jgi:hypothetical protein
MNQASVKSNLGDLNRTMVDYHLLSGNSMPETLTKQGAKLVREISFQLRYISRPKGAIRSEIMQRLRAGRFIKIRKSVVDSVTAKWTDKAKRKQARAEDQYWGETRGRDNWKWTLQQQLVKREIGVRESGKGVLGFSSRYSQKLESGLKVLSRYGPELSNIGLEVLPYKGKLVLFWPGKGRIAENVAKGIGDPHPFKAVADAISIVRQDILTYVERKRLEIAKSVVKSVVKQST